MGANVANTLQIKNPRTDRNYLRNAFKWCANSNPASQRDKAALVQTENIEVAGEKDITQSMNTNDQLNNALL